MAKEKEEEQQEEQVYEELAQLTTPRDVELPSRGEEGDIDTPQTLSESMDASTDLTDMQAAMTRLFPGKATLNDVMIARIAPEVFLSALHLMSVDQIMRHRPDETLEVNKIYLTNYTLLSVGLDGMGRIDVAEIAGAAREEKKAQAALRGVLGGGG